MHIIKPYYLGETTMKTHHKFKKLFIALTVTSVAAILSVSLTACDKPSIQQSTTNALSDTYQYGDYAYDLLKTFNSAFSKRQAGTNSEKMAAQYIENQLDSFGYDAIQENFTYTTSKGDKNSQNVVATKKAKTDNAKDIIIGAHYDSVTAGTGADDNASGVAVMLDCAKYISQVDADYDVIFIAFGAEEVGLKGSKVYVSTLSEQQISEVELYVNLDTLAAGDYTYAYGGSDEKSQAVLSEILSHSQKNSLGLITQEGKNPEYPKGTTGDWSDHASFKKVGIPFIYFESTNWDIGLMDGSSEVSLPNGDYEIMHTQFDNLDFIEAMFPGRVKAHMVSYVTSLVNIALGNTFVA